MKAGQDEALDTRCQFGVKTVCNQWFVSVSSIQPVVPILLNNLASWSARMNRSISRSSEDRKRKSGRLVWFAAVIILVASAAFGQVLNQHEEPKAADFSQTGSTKQEIRGAVKVTVQADKPRGFLPPRGLGVFSSVGDNQLMDPIMPQILQSSRVTTLRYPGGAYADNYHWSTYKPTKWQGTDQLGYYASQNDFGNFVHLVDQIGTAVITVNYGSSLDGTGGGTPQEAAAWVAYAMGDPANTKPIGKDSTGHDWQTIGYWAGLRASQPLASDDGLNFLRIGLPNPVLIKYWEVGNEAYKNGYYGGQGTEEDLHAAYPKDPKDNEKQRRKNANLSPDAYGNNLLQYIKTMKAVDGRIKVGASLDIPLAGDWNTSGDWVQDPITTKWVEAKGTGLGGPQKNFDGSRLGPERSQDCGQGDRFRFSPLVHGRNNRGLRLEGHRQQGTLLKTQDDLPKIMAGLLDLFQKYCGQNMQNMQLLVTEFGITPWIKVNDEIVSALLAADAYATLVEDGAANIDWAELHKNGFLNDENKPGPAYFAPQLIRQMANLNDKIVTAASSNALLAVHASLRNDGSVGVMFINKDPKNNATVKVTVTGASLAAKGTRFDFGKSNPASQYAVAGVPADGLGNSFTVIVPSYTITDLVIPKAQ